MDLGMDPKTEKFNSALYWFPRIETAGLPVPETRIVELPSGFVWHILGEDESESEPAHTQVWGQIIGACEDIGYPVFIRSDKGSAKHAGPASYRANSKADIGNVVARTIENDLEHDLVGERFPQAILVRRWIDLNGSFTAFGGTRIAREFRFFATAEGVLCSHFYWPEEAMRFEPGDNPPANWKAILWMLRSSRDPSVEVASQEAVDAAKACSAHPKWSVDFAEDKEGNWWLIDMAIAERSWHPTDCQNEAEIRRRVTSK